MADYVERIEPLSLDLGRNELDVDARPVVARPTALRHLARVLGDDARLLFLGRRRRRLLTAAQHQAQDGQRQLSVILRQLFGLLAQKPALESLVFFTQVRVQLLVFVALALELLQLRALGVKLRQRVGDRRRTNALAHHRTNAESQIACQATTREPRSFFSSRCAWVTA